MQNMKVKLRAIEKLRCYNENKQQTFHRIFNRNDTSEHGLPNYRRLPQTTTDYRKPMSMFTADQRK